MSDSLRNDENLTTADIARRQTPRQVRSEVLYRGPVPVPGHGDREREDRPERIAPDTEAVQVPGGRNAGPSAAPVAANANVNPAGPLFPDDELHNFRARWDQVQTS